MSEYKGVLGLIEEDAREEGREEGIEIVARNMILAGLDLKAIASLTSLSLEQLETIRDSAASK